MRFYLAPLEGITGWVFRSALHEIFGEGIDAYYSPFIVPHEKRALAHRDIENISPEHNLGMHLVPQILTNSVPGFLFLEKEIRELGYDEVNLNVGCPSKTVTSKGRGSGFLKNTDDLNAFLDGIFAGAEGKISVKTRIGWESAEEWEEILEIYNQYPICELIVHPRTGLQMYQGQVDLDAFAYAMENAKMPLCYNGDVDCCESYVNLNKEGINAIMIGRGILKNPALIRELSGGSPATKEEIRAFLRLLREGYKESMDNDTQILFKMKEVWNFLGDYFPGEEKTVKKLKKSKTLREYVAMEDGIFCGF